MVFLTEIRNMFWGVTIDGGKRYSQTVERSFHISMAALEPSSAKEKGAVSVMIQHEKAEFLLCTLDSGKIPQQPLDLNFTEGEEVTFFLSGPGIVHLTGFLLEEAGDYEDSMREFNSDLSSAESDDEEAPELEPISLRDTTKKDTKRKSHDAQLKGGKKKKIENEEDSEEESEDDSEEDPDYDYSKEESFFNDEAEEAEEESEEDEAEEDMVEEDEEDEEEESEEEQEEVKTIQSTPNTSKLSKKQKKEKRKSQEGTKQESNTPKKVLNNTQEVSTPISNNLEASGDASNKKKKKKKKKNKGQVDENATKQGDNTQKNKTNQSQTPKKKVVAGGTVVEELKVGSGSEVKPGKMVHMYYTGKLANNGKQFDSCISGKPFRFKLGKNEVIKGWETGVNGMKVGGKRRLTIPAQQAYGSQKTGPIPPNSTLVFDIELKAVS